MESILFHGTGSKNAIKNILNDRQLHYDSDIVNSKYIENTNIKPKEGCIYMTKDFAYAMKYMFPVGVDY
jgi:hypothetical protein